jgi:hypothetical protein
MPRRSKESLTVITTLTPGSGRPEPPWDFDEDEHAIWREIVGAMPANWFKTEAQPVLQALVTHIVTSREMARRLRADRTKLSLESLRSLTTMQARENAIIATLSAALRLTPKSQYTPHVASTKSREAKRSRPWEVRGEN